MVVRWLSHLSGAVAPVFMLHRFADPESGVDGQDLGELRELLAFLRRYDYRVLPLVELIADAEQGKRLARTVAFTVDDGYRDFYDVGAPVFREFDCPVTVFLTTGFLDGSDWFWWDKVEHAVNSTRESRFTLPLPDGRRVHGWSSPDQRAAVLAGVARELKTLPTTDKHRVIDALASQLHVDLPATPPERYTPMNWDQVRELGRQGFDFGPHTVSHPVLSRVPEQQSDEEVRESWRRVREEVPEHVPVFCYPNGNPASFSMRETRILQSAGLEAAVTAVEGYVRPSHFDPDRPVARYAIPRIAFGGGHRRRLRTVAGLGRFRRSRDDEFQKQVASW
jgi:peptidoglycan/xylan/chitin deacetylase (PgdA/CDA1 family)